MKNIIIFCFLISCCISCTPVGVDRSYRIRIFNDTDDTIKYGITYQYPDTNIPVFDRIVTCEPRTSGSEDSKDEWAEVFQKKARGGKLSVFFFSPDTLRHYSWEDVQRSYNILGRKDVTLEQLQNSNYEIHFP